MTLSLPPQMKPDAAATPLMARRSAGSHAAFVLPLLRPGMRILDCGCGPGGITLGLAEKVRPGGVIGLDMKPGPLAAANEQAANLRLNAAFMQGSVYELPFRSLEFDGVFAHALFEHLRHPQTALTELHRVMKPGAFLALRSSDHAALVVTPEGGYASAVRDACAAVLGGWPEDGLAGRKLAGWVQAAGFQHVTPTAGYEMHPAAALVDALLETASEPQAEAIQIWACQPGAMVAQPWFEVLAWKPWQ